MSKAFYEQTLARALRAGEPIARDDLIRYLRLALPTEIAKYVIGIIERQRQPKKHTAEQAFKDRLALRLYDHLHTSPPENDEKLPFSEAIEKAASHAGIAPERLRRLLTKAKKAHPPKV
jgi:hypothetical protein